MSDEIKLYSLSAETGLEANLPYANGGIHAGFPSPAQDYMTDSIDINKVIIQHREATFYARVSGDSMIDAGVGDGDIVVIDKSLEAKDGDYVAAYIDGDFALKQFHIDQQNCCGWLLPANKKYEPIRVTEENEFMIWGVITFVVKKMHV